MQLSSLIPDSALAFVKVSGVELLDRIGHDELREIVADVLCGENIRTATEPITRRRISVLNAALLVTIARASELMSIDEMFDLAHREIRTLPSTDPKRTVLTWLLGMTGKQIQNVLRSDRSAWADFVRTVKQATSDSAATSEQLHDQLTAKLELGNESYTWDWAWTHSLMVAGGSQTLATRGSEKSMYGKFFEKLVLGSVLDVLGFSYDADRQGRSMTFWLSERGEKRESDATAIVAPGEGIRFDIGFIGPGNTEISLDKVSRFSRVDEVAGQQFDMMTVIIVDRIGDGSRIAELAAEIDGTILQMSSSLWAKSLDTLLSNSFQLYKSVFPSTATPHDIHNLVVERLRKANFSTLLAKAR